MRLQDVMEIRAVEVADVLRARDARVERQDRMQRETGLPLISFTMNIAGPVKRDAWIERAFLEGVARIEWALAKRDTDVKQRERTLAFTGCEQLWAVDAPAQELKARMCALEEADALGRLFDIDVIDADGRKLERALERRCLICGGPVRACARSRTHSARELSERAHEIIRDFFASKRDAGEDDGRKSMWRAVEIGSIAHSALLLEAFTTPKPGLVDRENCGAHRDMDLPMFCKSADALLFWFEDCARIGLAMRDAAPEQVFARLRKRGIEAEKAMYAATGGVNTHKGALFSLGILCCAAAMAGETATTPEVLECAAALAKPSLEDLTHLRPGEGRTGGERQYLQAGRTGVRGEAAAGFPSARKYGLPALRRALERGEADRSAEDRLNDAGLYALLALMAHLEDSNILRRRGAVALRSVQDAAAKLLARDFTHGDLRCMNDAFVRENLSPGGSADLLSVCYFLYFLETDDGENPADADNGGEYI